MSQGDLTVVRRPLRVREQSSRTLDQRLGMRFPWLFAAFARLLIGGLRPTSRVRRAVVDRSVQVALEAYNRRDLEAASIAFHPDLEYYPYREFVEAGLAEPCYHKPSGYRAYIGTTEEVWGEGVRLEPTELIDLGNRLVVLADMPMRAQASGVPLSQKYATVATLRDGRVIRQRDYLNQAEALDAVGLSE